MCVCVNLWLGRRRIEAEFLVCPVKRKEKHDIPKDQSTRPSDTKELQATCLKQTVRLNGSGLGLHDISVISHHRVCDV